MNIPVIPDGTTKADAALAYARAGIPVFPVAWVLPDLTCCCGGKLDRSPRDIGKHPMITEGFKGATTDEATVAGWWSGHPDANIGSPLDAKTIALDIDDATKWDEAGIILPKTGPVQITGGATKDNQRRHHIYHLNGYSPEGLITTVKDFGAETKGLDLGYILLAPSNHVSGGEYRWGRAGATEPLPEPVHALLTAPKRKEASKDPSDPFMTVKGGSCANWCDSTGPISRNPGGYKYINDFAFHRVTYHRDTQQVVIAEQLLPLLDRMDPPYPAGEGTAVIQKVLHQIGLDIDTGRIGPDPVLPDPPAHTPPEPDDEFDRQMERNSWSLGGLLDLKVEQVPMIIDGLTPRRGLGMILGSYKAGKTSFGLQLAESIAMEDGAVFGLPVNEPLNVWVNEAEGSRESLQAKMAMTHRALGSPHLDMIDGRLRLTYRQINLGGDLKGGLDRIRRMYDHYKCVPDVLMVGVLMRISDIKDENASSQMQPVMNALDAFAAEYDNLVIFSHHTGKMIRDEKGNRLGVAEFFNKARGSGVTLGSVDFAIAIDRLTGEDNARINVMLRDGATSSFDVDFNFPLFVPPAGRTVILVAPSDDVSKAIIETLGDASGQTQREINENVNAILSKPVSPKTIERRVKNLVSSGTVVERAAGRNTTKVFSLASTAKTRSSGSSDRRDEPNENGFVTDADEPNDEPLPFGQF